VADVIAAVAREERPAVEASVLPDGDTDTQPPPVEIAPIADGLEGDPASESDLQWLGDVSVADGVEVVTEVEELSAVQDSPAVDSIGQAFPLAAVAEPVARVAVSEPARAADIALQGKRIALRRVVYVQDGAVLPLSARRLRRTMARVRPLTTSPSPQAAEAARSTPSTRAAAAGPSSEAFHDDGL
jgi:hypothetical protein